MLREESLLQGPWVPTDRPANKPQRSPCPACLHASLGIHLDVDDTRVAWRLHWSQRLSLFSPSLTLRRSSFVSTRPIIHDDVVKVADRACPPDAAEERGLRHPESRRITVISLQVDAKIDWRAESRGNRPVQQRWLSFRVCDAKGKAVSYLLTGKLPIGRQTWPSLN